MIEYDAQQREAIELIQKARLGVITGPPGVGKTTCIREGLAKLSGDHIALCAPTGKAAKRMTEATGAPAQTIHRLLQWSRGRFMRNQMDPLDHDLVICDESSMLDLFLAADLANGCSADHTRVIFVGDVNQLPPVGPGRFFHDLIAANTVPTVRLSTLHRAAQGSWIYRNAPRVLEGKNVEMDDCGDFEWHVGEDGDPTYLADTVVEILKRCTLGKVQVLSPMRVREGGSFELNTELQRAFNAGHGGFPTGYGDTKAFLRPGDPVIQTRNNYELRVFNGETGIVANLHGGNVVVQFDDEERVYTREQASDLELAYAITGHKSQGSEWPDVVVVCHSSHGFMLNRQWLYTALTRAKKRVFIVGDEAGFKQALSKVSTTQRVTKLTDRIRGAL